MLPVDSCAWLCKSGAKPRRGSDSYLRHCPAERSPADLVTIPGFMSAIAPARHQLLAGRLRTS